MQKNTGSFYTIKSIVSKANSIHHFLQRPKSVLEFMAYNFFLTVEAEGNSKHGQTFFKFLQW